MIARVVLASLFVGLAILAPWHFVAAALKGDPEAGARTFGYCAQCHSLQPGVNMTGPSLAGIFGRRAGSLKDFDRYSPALTHSGVVWDTNALDAWLADPTRFIPHSYMTFPSINDAQTRANLITLLRLAGPNGPTGAAMKAPEVTRPDLKSQPPARQVRTILYCGETYRVTTADGRTRPFWDGNLQFRTDQGADGPRPGIPIIMPTGMLGDRAAVMFSSPDEISAAIKHACQAKGGSER